MTPPTQRLRHLVSIEDLSAAQAVALLDSADAFLEVVRRPVRKVPTLKGKTVINLFYENSTRTRSSFELAGKRLSADVMNIAATSSSTKKGETLRDTMATLDAMHADVIIIRHWASGAARYLADRTRAAVVNAGDGMHEHPTQALLDAFTIRRHKGTLEGLKVAICGDIIHSRVARSNALLLNKLGAEVRLAGPRTLLPKGIAAPGPAPYRGAYHREAFGCRLYDRIEPAIVDADVVMMLRIQQERLGDTRFPNLREYARIFGLNSDRLKKAKPDAIVMHPGPLNRGVELADDIADSNRSVILEQVEAGVATRMAVLYHCVQTTPEA